MNKSGMVKAGITPCADCGRPSEAVLDGEGYCMTHWMKRRYREAPAPTPMAKLAAAHAVKGTE